MTRGGVAAWEWRDRPGLDVLAYEFGDDFVTLRGRALVESEAGVCRLSYLVTLDGQWRVREASVSTLTDGAERAVTLRRDGHHWTINGMARTDLQACVDLDIMGTPSTNTLPVRRLSWHAGQTRDLWMAYVRLPDLAVIPVEQRYTCSISPGSGPGTGACRFEYRSLASGFRAELLLDEQGWITDYPPYWQRVA